MGAEFPLFLARGNATNCWVVADSDQFVAHCGFMPRTLALGAARLRVGLIGAVCTLPEYAGKGLGTMLLDATLAHAQRCGISLVLISGGRGLYQRRGARFAGRFQRYTLAPNQWRHWRARDLVWRPYAPNDAPHVLALHDAAPVRFMRTAPALDAAALARPCGRTTMVALRHERVVAYCVYTRDAEHLTMDEWRGDAHALTQCADAMPPDYCGAITLVLPAHTQAPEPLRRCADATTPATFSGTMLVLDGPALVDQLRPYWHEHSVSQLRGAPRDNGFIISDATTRVALTAATTAAFFWGGQDAPAMPEQWRHCLPLPLCEYGLDYI
jgi:predicted N-acetyltransferase YhbS